MIALVLSTAVSPAKADTIPGLGLLVDFHYSLDRTPVRVVFVHPRAKTGTFPDLVIPRAYIYFVNRAPKGVPIPDRIESDDIGILFAEGTGEAWTLAVQEKARREGGGQESAADRMPGGFNAVQLSPTTNPRSAEDTRDAIRGYAKPAEPFEGLQHFKEPASTFSRFIGEESDEFWTIKCPDPANSKTRCQYSMRITDQIVGQVMFSDFRLNGGRAEANRRLRFVREVVCRYLDRCGPKS